MTVENIALRDGLDALFNTPVDNISGTKWAFVRLAFGSANTATLVSAADPLPVTGVVTGSFLTDAQLRATPVPVSIEGTVTIEGDVIVTDVSINNFPATYPVTGAVEVSNFPASFAVSNFPSNQPVTGPLTDAELRAAPVEILDSRETIAGLSFVATLAPLGSFTTSWVDILNVNWLDIHAEVASASALTALIEFTDAPDPNATPPGAGDIVRGVSTTLAGAALGGINTPSFGLPAQMAWARVRVTDLTGGQTVKVRFFGNNENQTAAQLPLIAALTDDFRVPIVRSVGVGKQPDGTYANMPVGGRHSANSSTTPLGAGATFTGVFIDQTAFGAAAIHVLADKDGTLLVDNSGDGVVTDRVSSFSVLANVPFFIGLSQLTRYIRVRYTNGATPQGSFRVQRQQSGGFSGDC
jgi:hypothetical protein